MLCLAGGVGITPFISVWRFLLANHERFLAADPAFQTDIAFLFTGRSYDLELLRHLLNEVHGALPPSIRLMVHAFQTTLDAKVASFPLPVTLHERRIERSDFESIEDLREREIYLCGPPSLMADASGWLEELDVLPNRIHQEAFDF